MEPIHWDTEQDGELSATAMRRKMEKLGCTVTQYTYPPGTYFSPHTHAVDKIDGILAGHFELTMAGASVVLGPGDMLAVPKGALHSARVIGDEPVVSLDGIKTGS